MKLYQELEKVPETGKEESGMSGNLPPEGARSGAGSDLPRGAGRTGHAAALALGLPAILAPPPPF